LTEIRAFYYIYVDEGFSRKWKSGKVKRNLTKAFMKREKVLDQIEKIAAISNGIPNRPNI
jgi:hypothetical protein